MDLTHDNATLTVHDLYPDKLLMVASRHIAGSTLDPGPIYLPYGGYYWCDDRHPLAVQIQAVRRYNIDIRRSTEATDGLWRNLINFAALCEIFPDIPPAEPVPPIIPLSATHLQHRNEQPPNKRKRKKSDPLPKDSRQKTLREFVTSSRVGVAAGIDSPSYVMLDSRVSCFDNNLQCLDSSEADVVIPVHPDFLPLASTITLSMGTSATVVNSHTRSVLHSQEDNLSAKQDSTAPVPCRTVLADLSYPHMEYDKKLVFK